VNCGKKISLFSRPLKSFCFAKRKVSAEKPIKLLMKIVGNSWNVFEVQWTISWDSRLCQLMEIFWEAFLISFLEGVLGKSTVNKIRFLNLHKDVFWIQFFLKKTLEIAVKNLKISWNSVTP
jgi:hypothetical protein